MCGICGIFDMSGQRQIDERALRRMASSLAHRGPDGEGVHIEPGLGLAHRRLAIIDFDGGAQPYFAASGHHALVFNGEIYNFRDLSRALAAQGVALRTRSDTEVLAEGLAHTGADFVDELHGMFAFAHWDRTQRTLTLVRDRIGEKPLYYAITASGLLVFASELQAIVASGLVDIALDPEAMSEYFLYGYVPDPKSALAAVRKLPPGSRLVARPGSIPAVTRYWRPTFDADASLDFAEATARLLPILDEIVRSQTIADVPLGVFLSSGVDSAAIAASLAAAGQSIDACTVGFDGGADDERARASALARDLGLRHHSLSASIDSTALIDRIAAIYAEPFADSSALPMYLISKAARSRVKVALSGDGGDEVFAGYRRYRFFQGEETIRRLVPSGMRKPVFGAAGALWPKLDWAPRPLRFKTTLQALGEDRAQSYVRAVAINRPQPVAQMLSGDFRHRLNGYDPGGVIMDHFRETTHLDPVSAAQATDFETWLPGRMLVKVDRASMANSLEVRPPFLDHRLVSWAGGLPAAFKLHHGTGKHILKQALMPRLPTDILKAPKKGFGLPLKDWLRAPNGPVERLQASSVWRQSGYLDPARVDAMLAAHRAGRSDFAQELWTVIMFDAFLSLPMLQRAPASAHR